MANGFLFSTIVNLPKFNEKLAATLHA